MICENCAFGGYYEDSAGDREYSCSALFDLPISTDPDAADAAETLAEAIRDTWLFLARTAGACPAWVKAEEDPECGKNGGRPSSTTAAG